MNAKLEYVQELYKKRLDCGKSLLELTTYDNVSLWWIVDTLFCNFIKNMTVDDGTSKLYPRKVFIVFYQTIGIHIKFLYDLGLKVLLSIAILILRKYDQGEKKSKKIILLTPDKGWMFVRDYETNKLKKGDAIFHSLITKLKNNYNLLAVYSLDIYPIKGVKIFIDKLRSWYVPYKLLNIYWSPYVWKKERDALKHFKKSWHYLKSDKKFRELCVCNGRDLYNRIIEELELYFFFLFPLAVSYIELGKLMIDSEKPNLILLENEEGWRERAFLVIASKLENTPTLAVQHGCFDHTQRGSMHPKDEISPVGSVKLPYCPIPDKTAVYGNYYKELLTKAIIYPENSVVVTGHPRYDILADADKIYSKEKFLKRYNINPNHKIVLWTTGCPDISDEENVNNFKAVFETMQNLKNVTLIIKQHPGEGERYRKMIEEYLYNYKISAVVAPKNSDTYEQIFICDLMITKTSTTAIEAVALNKPVIILNLSGNHDIIDYIKEGVALGVYKEEDLKQAIEKLLKDDTDLAMNRKSYIEKHLYKIDGKATERVADLITQMIEKSRREKDGK